MPAQRVELCIPPEVVRGHLVVTKPGMKWQFRDSSQRALAEFKVQSDRVKVKDAQDREILKVKRKDDGWELEDANGRRLLRARKRDGVWKVSDGSEATVAVLTPIGDGVQIEDSRGRQVARVLRGAGQVRFQGASGQGLAVVRGISEPLTAAWFLVPDLDPVAQAAVVVYTLEVR